MGSAKQFRMGRFIDRVSHRGIIVPIDHGLTMGPIDGLENVARIGRWVATRGIDGVIAHKGIAERLVGRGLIDGIGLMVHLNGMHAMAGLPDQKELLTTAAAAQRLGADAVSVQLNFDGNNDAHNLRLLGAVADEAAALGLPLLTMLYDKKPDAGPAGRLRRLRHLMRLCIELGTDALKIAPPAQLAEVVEILQGLKDDALIFFAGGSLATDEALLRLAVEAHKQGAAGLCVGRNVFQRQAPDGILAELATIFHAPVKALPRLRAEASLGAH